MLKNNIKVLELQLQEQQLNSVANILENLTEGEYRVFRSLVQFIKNNDYSPTLADIANELEMSRQAAHKFFTKLEKKGYIKREGTAQIKITYKDAEITVENVEKLRPALENLKQLFEDHLITEIEYEDKKRQILGL